MGTILQYFLAFILSVITSYIDLTTFFLQRARFRISPFTHFPSLAFLIFNGSLASVLMFVAVENKWITNDRWSLALISGLGTAGLLRSKFFTFGQANTEAGLEYLYNFFKNQTIAKLANDSGAKKIALSFQLADTYLLVQDVITKMNNVSSEIAKSVNWDAERIARFNAEYQQVKDDPSYIQLRDRLAAMMRVFIDHSERKYVTNLLANFLQ